MTGITGVGKSSLLRHLFLTTSPPRLVIDPVGSLLTAVPGAATFSDPLRFPDAQTARFVPHDPLDLDAYNALYATARARVMAAFRSGDMERARLWIWLDEAGIVMPASGAPREAEAVVIAGRKAMIGHAACHTRPRECARSLLAQAQHLLIGSIPLQEDRDYVSRTASIPRDLLESALAAAGESGFAWYQQRTRTLTPLLVRFS